MNLHLLVYNMNRTLQILEDKKSPTLLASAQFGRTYFATLPRGRFTGSTLPAVLILSWLIVLAYSDWTVSVLKPMLIV